MSKKSSFAARKKRATPTEAFVKICLDQALYRRYYEAKSRLEQVKLNRGESTTLDAAPTDAELHALIADVVQLSDAVVEAEELYVFRKLGRPEWKQLSDDHPVLDEVRKAEEDAAVPLPERSNIDPETFWPAAIAACAHDPELSVEDALWLRDGDDEWPGLPEQKWDEICATVQALHQAGLDIPKEFRDIDQILKRELSGITHALGASRSASSGAGSQRKGSRTG
ncbi:hypothetical protein [Phytoactinopolyspora limicola]|uniref:hypothetical protein n=1 Tax=Phytoactinopolyspora limicola TaxID=2715536 RepID=UPI001409E8CB|nr:hypothetical protein [Phytoactinopolyspora limicola]